MKRAGPGWFLLALAGLAAVFGAFLPFYTYADGIDVTVWSRGLFPTAALIPLLGAAIGIEAVFAIARGHEPRSPFLNFTWEQARLATGTFMILLSLSYLLQDRAGGTLGIGYALLAGSSLATFAGGVVTRRAQLARAPGELEEREHRPVIGPALATIGRASGDVVKNVADRGHKMRVRLAEQREARAAARKEAAEKAAALRAEQAAVDKLAAENAPPAPPTATLESLPTTPHPPAATLDELPADEPAPQDATVDAPERPAPGEETAPEPAAAESGAAAEAIEATEPLEASHAAEDEPDDTAELPVADTTDAVDELTIEQPLVAQFSAVPAETDPDATLQSDGDTATPAEEEEEEEKEKERADTGTEGPPST